MLMLLRIIKKRMYMITTVLGSGTTSMYTTNIINTLMTLQPITKFHEQATLNFNELDFSVDRI